MCDESACDVAGASRPAAADRDFELCIHVGHIKTATTWLQKTVFADPESGFITPWDQARGRAIAAFVSVNPYTDDPRWARAFFEEGLRAMVGDPRVPILSEEILSGDPTQRRYTGRYVADRIHAVFPKARILIGVREQKSMALSTYREYVIGGGLLPLEDYVGRGDEPLGYMPILYPDYLEYDRMVGYYQALYGRENVLVMPFERLRSDATGYIRAILEFCRCPGRIERPASAKHVGLSAPALAVRRRLNPLVKINPLSPHWSRSHELINRICVRIDKITRGQRSAVLERRWEGVVARRYEGVFRDSNRRLSESTGIDFGALGYEV